MTNLPDQSELQIIFPPIIIPSGDISGVGPEAMSYNQHFGGKSWPDVKRKYYERHTEAFLLMDHISLSSYIGGFIDIALSNQNSVTAEYLVYFAGSKDFSLFCQHLNLDQITYLLNTIDHLITDEYYSENDRVKFLETKESLIKSGLTE